MKRKNSTAVSSNGNSRKEQLNQAEQKVIAAKASAKRAKVALKDAKKTARKAKKLLKQARKDYKLVLKKFEQSEKVNAKRSATSKAKRPARRVRSSPVKALMPQREKVSRKSQPKPIAVARGAARVGSSLSGPTSQISSRPPSDSVATVNIAPQPTVPPNLPTANI